MKNRVFGEAFPSSTNLTINSEKITNHFPTCNAVSESGPLGGPVLANERVHNISA